MAMNRTIKLLMVSDIFVLTGFGLIQPILAIFINDGVAGGSIFSAGLASTLFLLTKSVVQLPFSKYIDGSRNKRRWLLLGTLMTAIVPVLYIFVNNIYQVYIAEIVYGVGSGLAYPTWVGLYTTNLKEGQESFEWSIYSTLTGLGSAATAAVGASIAHFVGFKLTFIATGILCILGSMILLFLDQKSSEDLEEEIPHIRDTKTKSRSDLCCD